MLAVLRADLEKVGFLVEKSKKTEGKIKIPVLFGENGKIEKAFEADAFHEKSGFVLEVEAGRGVRNHQFLKDLFQACMMQNTFELGIAIRNVYESGGTSYKDYEAVCSFFKTLYASNRLNLPLKNILIIGY